MGTAGMKFLLGAPRIRKHSRVEGPERMISEINFRQMNSKRQATLVQNGLRVVTNQKSGINSIKYTFSSI